MPNQPSWHHGKTIVCVVVIAFVAQIAWVMA